MCGKFTTLFFVLCCSLGGFAAQIRSDSEASAYRMRNGLAVHTAFPRSVAREMVI